MQVLHQSIENSPLNNGQLLPRTIGPTKEVFFYRDLRFNLLFLNYKVHFVYQLSNKVVTDSYNFIDNEWEEKTDIEYVSKNYCSTMLHLFGKLTVFGGESNEVALYSLNSEKKSWEFVKSSKFPFHEMNPKHSACAQYSSSGKVRVVAIASYQASFQVYHFSPEKDGGTNWKRAVLTLPHIETQCQIQSCIVNGNNMYFSWLSNTHLFVHQINLGPLEQDDCSSIIPKRSWCLEKNNIRKFFFSTFEDDIVIIIVRGGNVIEVSYLSCFNFGSLSPLTLSPSTMEVITAAIVPDTTNMALLCHENNKHELRIINGMIYMHAWVLYMDIASFLCCV